jgi:hypothetical protein
MGAIYTDGVKYDCFKLHSDFNVVLSNGKNIVIPSGFETDFASIPRLFWAIYPPHWKPYRKASLVHDYLYMAQDIVTSRAFADAEFRRLLIIDGTNVITAWFFWAVCRLKGYKRWNKYKKNDNTNY